MTYPDNCPLIPSASTIPTVATTPDDKPSHADYNLSPLEVHHLDHYVKYEDNDERFHVC